MPDVDPKARATAINALLSAGKIDLYKSEAGLLYRSKKDEAPSLASGIKGDAEEKLVYKIVEDAGNMGTWIRDIRVKSNLAQASLTKVRLVIVRCTP